MISFDEFKKVEIRIGKILSCEKVPDTDKLLLMSLDLGEEEPRTIVSGIAHYFPDTRALVGKQVPVLANLEPRMIRGIESKGMILAIGEENNFTLLTPEKEVMPGAEVR